MAGFFSKLLKKKEDETLNKEDKENLLEEESLEEQLTDEEIEEMLLEEIEEKDETNVEISTADVKQKLVQEPIEDEVESKGFFRKLKEGLLKTRNNITGKVNEVLKSFQTIDDDLFDELEEILITSDVGVETTMKIIEDLKDKVKSNKIKDPMQIKDLLKKEITDIMGNDIYSIGQNSPEIILVIGVNGVGKTTSIGKISNRLKKEGKKVIIAAADTFRAAAIDQLDIWAVRSNVEIIKHQEGSDPAAVIFDAISSAKSKKADVLICDTAGRLHNKKNLMDELKKIFKVIEREYPQAHKEVLLVLDATTGQNAISQAKIFKEVANITGIILTKLDGTAKGGIVIAIKSELDIPVKLIGVGEKVDDLQDFSSNDFVNALFSE